MKRSLGAKAGPMLVVLDVPQVLRMPVPQVLRGLVPGVLVLRVLLLPRQKPDVDRGVAVVEGADVAPRVRARRRRAAARFPGRCSTADAQARRRPDAAAASRASGI